MTVLFPTSRRSQRPESQPRAVSEPVYPCRNYESQGALFSQGMPPDGGSLCKQRWEFESPKKVLGIGTDGAGGKDAGGAFLVPDLPDSSPFPQNLCGDLGRRTAQPCRGGPSMLGPHPPINRRDLQNLCTFPCRKEHNGTPGPGSRRS